MIDYEEDWVYHVLCHCKGSVAFRAAVYALPSSLLALAIHIWHDEVEDFMRESGIDGITPSQTWSSASAVLSLLLAFRTAQALSRFWEGTSLLHQMRGEWFDAVSCLVTFSRGAKATKLKEVMNFRHALIRLMSLCHGSALEEIADTDHLVALDVFGIDHSTLKHLKECKQEYGFNRVECILHLFQTLVTKSLDEGVLPIAPPILSRVYQTLSRGFVNLLNAKKITDTRFPFPYAQLITILLFLVMILTPLMMASLIPNAVFACIYTFVPIFGMFSLNFVASQLENPFGNDDNDLPLVEFQTEMNKSLLMLLHDKADHVPCLSKICVKDFQNLVTCKRPSTTRRSSLCYIAEWAESQEIEEEDRAAASSEQQASQVPVDMSIWFEELEPATSLLCNRVEEFGLMLPQWTQMIETQVAELARSFSALQDLVDSDKVGPPGKTADADPSQFLQQDQDSI